MESSFTRLQEDLQDKSSDIILEAAQNLSVMAHDSHPDRERWTPLRDILYGAAEMLDKIVLERSKE